MRRSEVEAPEVTAEVAEPSVVAPAAEEAAPVGAAAEVPSGVTSDITTQVATEVSPALADVVGLGRDVIPAESESAMALPTTMPATVPNIELAITDPRPGPARAPCR